MIIALAAMVVAAPTLKDEVISLDAPDLFQVRVPYNEDVEVSWYGFEGLAWKEDIVQGADGTLEQCRTIYVSGSVRFRVMEIYWAKRESYITTWTVKVRQPDSTPKAPQAALKASDRPVGVAGDVYDLATGLDLPGESSTLAMAFLAAIDAAERNGQDGKAIKKAMEDWVGRAAITEEAWRPVFKSINQHIARTASDRKGVIKTLKEIQNGLEEAGRR